MNNPVFSPVRVRHHVLLLNNQKVSTPKEKCPHFASVEAMVREMRPLEPVHCLRPEIIESSARWFLEHFPGDVMYSVKSNPDPKVLGYLAKAGVQNFDIASLAEIALIAEHQPRAKMHFMHPVKSREAIAKAYYDYGIRHFSLDSEQELQKILEVTGYAKDLHLYVRLSIPNDKAAYSLTGKFGIPVAEAGSLLLATRKAAFGLGICFHVGSQCMHPDAWRFALAQVSTLLAETGVKLDALDIGGGFPSVYPGMTPPPMGDYMRAIEEAVAAMKLPGDCQLLAEPGRALVAEGGSLVVKVELRKGNMLYINDGVYGSLFDAGYPGFVFPAKAIREQGEFAADLQPFGLFGPTCDSLDAMKGPFHLPSDIGEGDWIEIGQMGAYGATLRTRFNGFYSDTLVEVADRPIMSMWSIN